MRPLFRSLIALGLLSGLLGSLQASEPKAELQTFARFVPERADDFAWENDWVAFRAYGPAIAKGKGTEDSGIDCWPKRVRIPIINTWYGLAKEKKSYHVDYGQGCDFYHVGSSRGCGGTALWDGQAMVLGRPYVSQKVISCQPAESVFELTYHYPDHPGFEGISETRRFTIRLGELCYHVKSSFTKGDKPLVGQLIAVGVTTHEGKAITASNKELGWVAAWETFNSPKAESNYGELGTGARLEGSKLAEIREIPKDAKLKDQAHILLLTPTDAQGQIAYKAGFGWSKAGRIESFEAWKAYLSE